MRQDYEKNYASKYKLRNVAFLFALINFIV